jgi:micrococcal nuclease
MATRPRRPGAGCTRPVAARLRAAATAAMVVVTAVACGGGRTAAAPSPPPPVVELPPGLDTTVDRVVDGDTIVVAGGHHVRLIGIDTPETKDPRKPVQCFGREASAFVAELLPSGTGVRLIGDVEARDVYDRTLAYVYRLPDGLFVNADVVRQGYARVLTIPPNVAYTDELLTLAQQAREAGRGLWSACGDDP